MVFLLSRKSDHHNRDPRRNDRTTEVGRPDMMVATMVRHKTMVDWSHQAIKHVPLPPGQEKLLLAAEVAQGHQTEISHLAIIMLDHLDLMIARACLRRKYAWRIETLAMVLQQDGKVVLRCTHPDLQMLEAMPTAPARCLLRLNLMVGMADLKEVDNLLA